MIQGPIHFDYLNKIGEINFNPKGFVNPNLRGIYVWGFMYEYDGELQKPIDFSEKHIIDNYYNNGCNLPKNWRFLPYYVGKKEDSIFDRIKTHHKIRHGDATKYIRLSFDYLKYFFKDPDFPIKYNRVRNINQVIKKFQKNQNAIDYFNHYDFLNLKYPNSALKANGRNLSDYPITDQRDSFGMEFNDTLNEIIILKNNFWFCYLPIEDTNLNLVDFESFVFWSLKGATVSQTKKFEYINKKLRIIDNTGLDIFKLNDKNELTPSSYFSGY